jgi:AcrR family transcriptional regulator
VITNQRDRILLAVADVTSAKGYAQTSVEDIIASAGVSRRTFYDLYKNKQDAFLAAYDEAVSRLMRNVVQTRAQEQDFAARMIVALRAFLHTLEVAPSFARMCIVEVLAAGPEAVRRRNAAIAGFVAVIEDDARTQFGREPRSPLAVEMLVGGIYESVYRRLMDGSSAELGALLPEFVYAALAPYVGKDAAAKWRRRLIDELDAAAAQIDAA